MTQRPLFPETAPRQHPRCAVHDRQVPCPDCARGYAAERMVRANDPGTSASAAERVGRRLSSLQEQVLAAFRAQGPMTAREAEELPAFETLSPSTVRKRISELARLGALVPTEAVRDGCREYRVPEDSGTGHPHQ